ncbi:FR47-like protein [Andreesenia angusta]|uniref:FR47-like protein n=1 Tax=Andreesenia angusta TaxID=39480 RepID=A0A1S1VAG5_9FIRM|nr:GNAT family N-acetyltransferase [Andreesenia angusta]OHW63494.1 FR47-like protein [Andreesenia angusta]
MEKEKVSKKADENLIQAIKSRAAVLPEGDVVENSKYVLFTIGKDSEDGHLNGAICLDDSYAAETMRAAESYFNSLERNYVFWVSGSENKKLENLLKQSGYAPKREPGSAAMVIDRKIEGVELKSGYSIKSVESDLDRLDFAKVVSGSFEKDIELAEHMFGKIETLKSQDVSAKLIYEGEKPVASALTVLSGDMAGIYWVGVVEEKRREGLGAYIVQSATNEGFDRGASAVVLQASEAGEHLYKKLGYTTFKHYRWYPVKVFTESLSF